MENQGQSTENHGKSNENQRKSGEHHGKSRENPGKTGENHGKTTEIPTRATVQNNSAVRCRPKLHQKIRKSQQLQGKTMKTILFSMIF